MADTDIGRQTDRDRQTDAQMQVQDADVDCFEGLL